MKINGELGVGCTVLLQMFKGVFELSGRTKDGRPLFLKEDGTGADEIGPIHLADFVTFSEVVDLIALTHGLDTKVIQFGRSAIRIEFTEK